MIQPKTKKRRHDIETTQDTLSDLPQCVLVHILSFLNAKEAVQTCILSKRWKPIWKYIPTLKLHSSNFSTLKSFDKFVSRVLSLRDKSIVLHAVDFHRNGSIESGSLKRVANYVQSRNVKLRQLGINVKGDIDHILPCISSCQTLTSLKLSVNPKGRYNYGRTLFPKSLNLPALTCLHLGNFAFCASDDGQIEPFSAFKRLNSLIIDNCSVNDAEILCITSETLVNLTMCNHSFDIYLIELSAPSLCTFAFMGTPYQIFSGNGLSSVKQVNIDAEMLANYSFPIWVLVSWLSSLANVKSLTVSASTLQVLSLIPDVLKDKLSLSSRMCSLKSLKVKLKPLSYGLSMAVKTVKLEKALKAGFEPSSPIPDGILELLLHNSPSANVDIVECSRIILSSYEEFFKLVQFDDAFDHLYQYSSSFFLRFLQPSSHKHVMDDLQLRVQHLNELVLQTNKYIHLAKEEIIQKNEEMSALKEHMKMFKKTLDGIVRQMHEAIKLQL
ncbi:hypothetical protein TSUD_65130 [Trifolium subterraneum]|uniref:F-box domain-containing protein n=1 Tax=Trifolium subterraneum TaxID=3900 RepID=A0A2Z6MCF0_TRISU|nr:hypothetical protein TSUD_65130 [Trifolium subterraneum]